MKLKIRGFVSLCLLLFWTISALSGIVLYLAPEGQRSGRALLVFGLTKQSWSSFHTWISFLALGFTVLHIILDRKILLAVLKQLIKK